MLQWTLHFRDVHISFSSGPPGVHSLSNATVCCANPESWGIACFLELPSLSTCIPSCACLPGSWGSCHFCIRFSVALALLWTALCGPVQMCQLMKITARFVLDFCPRRCNPKQRLLLRKISLVLSEKSGCFVQSNAYFSVLSQEARSIAAYNVVMKLFVKTCKVYQACWLLFRWTASTASRAR
jgi:hypothetical protein